MKRLRLRRRLPLKIPQAQFRREHSVPLCAADTEEKLRPETECSELARSPSSSSGIPGFPAPLPSKDSLIKASLVSSLGSSSYTAFDPAFAGFNRSRGRITKKLTDRK